MVLRDLEKPKEEFPFIPNSTAPTAGLSTKPREGSWTDPTLSSVMFSSMIDNSIFTDQDVWVMSC